MSGTTEPDTGEIAQLLRNALRRLPGPVSIVTSFDEAADDGAGMVASAVIPVSLAPPSMLVAVNRANRCHAVIEAHGRFCINLLGTDQTALVIPFSDPAQRARRFAEGGWENADGIPFLPAAMASIFCQLESRLVHGTHELFVGNVYAVRLGASDAPEPLGWMEGGFARFGALD